MDAVETDVLTLSPRSVRLAPKAGPRDAKRLPGLDGLRAFAIILVIAHHIVRSRNWVAASAWVPSGRVGVRIFFVLSGYLITWLLIGEREKRGGINLAGFYGRRAFRILPPALVYLMVLVVFAAAGAFTFHSKDLAACLLFVRNVFGDEANAPGYYAHQTEHFWSLSVEEQFYLFWPVILLLCRRTRRASAVACAIIAVPLAAGVLRHSLLGHGPLGARPADFALYLQWFGPIQIGCLLALVRADPAWGRVMNGNILRHAALPWACVAIVIALGLIHTGETAMPLVQSVCFALIVNYAISGRTSVADRILNWPPAQYIGRLSYSLYFWQQPFCWSPEMKPGWWQQMPLCLLLPLLCAMVSYQIIEQPALRIRSQLSRALPILK